MAASPIKRTNTVGGQYYSDSPSMHCLNSANNYYGFAGISRWDNHLIPQQQATEPVHILPLPIFGSFIFTSYITNLKYFQMEPIFAIFLRSISTNVNEVMG
jgi:hypothetical protein